MRRGLAGRADRRRTFKAGDDGAVGGGAIGLLTVGCRTFLNFFDCLDVDREGFVEKLLESFRL